MTRHRRAMQLIADARPAVLDGAPDRSTPDFPDPQFTGPRQVRPRRRLVVAGLVPTGAAAVLAVALAVGTSGPAQVPPPSQQQPGPVAQQPLTARGILLAAAAQSATATSSGTYWVMTTEQHHRYDVGGYTVVGRAEVESWQDVRPQGGVTMVSRWLGAAPATDADRIAWEKAGSPTSWTLTGPTGKPERALTSTPGPRKIATIAGTGFEFVAKDFTYAELQALPTDPVALEAYLVKLDKEASGPGSPQDAGWRVEMLFLQARVLLTQLPVSPATRAAAYRMLADQPGLTLTENVTDARGRTGVGVGHTFRNADGTDQTQRLVIDPQSGTLLAVEDRGGSILLLGERFTDTAPPTS
ncbi:MAG: CU044_5270 family protein [Hamadaea sp.]|nr:CU044_5270 family protein [Hamadaea sp.]